MDTCFSYLLILLCFQLSNLETIWHDDSCDSSHIYKTRALSISTSSSSRLVHCGELCSRESDCAAFAVDNLTCLVYSSWQSSCSVPASDSGIRSRHFTLEQRARRRSDGYSLLPGTDMEVKKYETLVNWTAALSVCRGDGGTLVKPHPKNMYEAIKKAFYSETKKPETPVWIGLRDKFSNNTWYWADGEKILPRPNNHWRIGQPENYLRGEHEDCAGANYYAFLGLKWFDTPCNSTTCHFVCERGRTQ